MLQSMNKFSTKVNTVYLFRCFVSKFSKLFISEKVIGRIKYLTASLLSFLLDIEGYL